MADLLADTKNDKEIDARSLYQLSRIPIGRQTKEMRRRVLNFCLA